VQLVFKISNLCGPDPPTSQADRQTDRRTEGDMQSQYRALHYSASRGKNTMHTLKLGIKNHYNKILFINYFDVIHIDLQASIYKVKMP